VFEEMYGVSHHETREWGSLWCGPDVLPHGEPTLIATLVAESEDGYAVEVFVAASTRSGAASGGYWRRAAAWRSSPARWLSTSPVGC